MDMDKIRIRNARMEDAPQLSNLSTELGYLVSIRDLLSRLPLLLNSDEHTILIAEDDEGQMLGWVHAALVLRVESRPFAEIGGIVVHSGHRNEGIGGQLIQRTEEWAAKRGMETLRLRSQIARDEAHRFFKNQGFCLMKEQLVFERALVGSQRGCRMPSHR